MKNNFKNSLKQQLAILKGELQLNFPIWLIQIIITLTTMAVLLFSCSMTESEIINDTSTAYPMFSSGSNLFQYLFQYFLIFLCFIFSLIYMIKSLSYLYNKRKQDMYVSMPITRRCFFTGKILSSFVISIMVFIVFQSISFIIGICSGATFESNEIANAVMFIFFVFFIICFYSLCAVCSKSSWNAVISMFIIALLFPFLFSLINYTACAFFQGLNSYYTKGIYEFTFFGIPKDANYFYIIYWVVFGIVFLLLSNRFIKKRNPENSKSSFVFPFMEYAIKILASLSAGALLGFLMGAISGSIATAAFIAGFIIAAVPVYIIVHIIYNRGFNRLLKSCIALAVLCVAGVSAFLVCDANPMNFNNSVPDFNEVESAGIIDTGKTYTEITPELINQSKTDFSDEETIKKILSLHTETIDTLGKTETNEKCMKVFSYMMMDMYNNIFSELKEATPLKDGYIISYKYKNGFENSYLYNNYLSQYIFSFFITSEINNQELYDNQAICDTLAEIEISQTYLEKYSPLYYVPLEEYSAIDVISISDDSTYVDGYPEYIKNRYTDYYGIVKESSTFEPLLAKLTEALKTDLKNDTEREKHCKPFLSSLVYYYGLSYVYSDYTDYLQNKAFEAKLVLQLNYDNDSRGFSFYIPESYTNTIQVLRDAHILRDDSYVVYNNAPVTVYA